MLVGLEISFAWKKFKFFFGYFFILLFDVALPNGHAATLNVGFMSILCRFYVLLIQNIKTTSKRCIKKDVYMSTWNRCLYVRQMRREAIDL